ncbi:integrin alpha-PS2-like isoform X2 [Belonocnema kinseyi]|uniref:integrin alpha-PS2-like isoform X2 n=1 Tax=Belonocnema kinseyi TaxID=2817044 RepID=UPI00143CF3D3|nr:integrin alpha-PS2-like isoform X2 [Belonocnema kinseyi]
MWLFWIPLGLIALLGSSPKWESAAFNVETRHYTIYKSHRHSMFGFSVAEYRDHQGYGSVIIGAPEAAGSYPSHIQKGGGVYKCDISQDNACILVSFDTRNDNSRTNTSIGMVQVDDKSGQWLGATVSSSKVDGGSVLACAPRYLWYGKQVVKGKLQTEKREPVGTCWLTNFSGSSLEFSPCRTGKQGYNLQGTCQAGLGAAMSKDGKRLFIGAPGSWYWQGQLYSMSSLDNRTKVLMTKEGSPLDDDSYMGYSVTSGDYQGIGQSDVAVGIPRGNRLMGQVAIFDSQMRNYRNITGEQMGGYFGYALASGDINGDGFEDLIIGAPMFTLPGNLEIIETGRVYIAYRAIKPDALFDKKDYRDGVFNRGRFGLSVAFLGDIDHDGYGDIAVGAPYGGREGRGAVYIYRGSKEGLREKESQVIFATDLEQPLQTFGFSVAGGQDLDRNTYPDMVVGAYESDSAVFLRSRPVIRADCKVEYFFPNHPKNSGINLDNKDCKVDGIGEQVSCLLLKVFLKYDGEYPSRDFDIELILDAMKTKNPRMFFNTDVGKSTMIIKNVSIRRNQEWSMTHKVYVTPHIRDKLTGIEAEARLTLSENREPDRRHRLPDMPLRPILAETTSLKDTIYIRKNCGEDNICIPDLQLYVNKSVNEYLIGSGQEFNLTITVKNMGEDAYEAMFYLHLPDHIEYINTEQLVDTGVFVQCFPPDEGKNVLRCDIGNPMPQGKMVKFKTRLRPQVANNMKPAFDFKMEVNTTNAEDSATTANNYQDIRVPLWVELELVVEGESRPKELFYNPDNYTSENITTDVEFGPAIVHNYTIRNNGPSNFLQADVIVTWPGKTLAGADLLYLMEEPQGQNKITCSNANFNYLHLTRNDTVKNRYSSTYYQHSYHEQSSSGIGVQKGYDNSNEGGRREVNIGDSSDFNQARHSQNTNYQEQLGTVEEGRKVSVISDGASGGYGVSSASINGDFHPARQNENSGSKNENSGWKNENSGWKNENSGWRNENSRWNQVNHSREESDRRGSVPVYGTERHYGEEAEERRRNQDYGVLTHTRFDDEISGDREEVVGPSGFDLETRNITTSEDLEEFFSKISRSEFKAYTKEGREFINFRGKFGIMDNGQKCIVLQDGKRFPLQDSSGRNVYHDGKFHTNRRFNPIEGELVSGPGNRAFIQLSNGLRFALEGYQTYSSTRTYYANPYGNEEIYGHSSGNSWHTESSTSGSSIEGDFEMHSSRSHEERRTNERRVQSREYLRNGDLPISENLADPRYESQRRHLRSRRQVDSSTPLGPHRDTAPGSFDSAKNPCKHADCFQIKCVLNGLVRGEEAHLSLKFRIKAATLKKVAFREPVQISTQVQTRITRFASLENVENQKMQSEEVFTNVEPTAPPPVADVVPLWVVVLSACAGVIILLLLILLLYKCGFFKRNRPTNVPERQPLNRNGHFHGDDH